MNTTILGNPRNKEEIKKLDEDIHYCLKSLTCHNPGSDEFRRVLKKEMFIKENTEAFIHVAHYLFTTLDEKEFHRRFYWPIRDRSDESKFRSDTVDYINFLIDKGELKMQKIKAVHVVHPGGQKFMEMMLCLIEYVMNEVLSRYDDVVEVPDGMTHDEFMRNIGEQAKKLNELDADLKKAVKEVKKQLEDQEKPVDEMLMTIFGTADIEEIEKFVDGLAQHNDERFEKTVSTYEKFDSTMEGLENLIRKTEKITDNSEETVEVNPVTLAALQAQFVDELLPGDKKNEFEELCNLTEVTLPYALEIIDQYPIPELKNVENISKELATLCAETDSVASEAARLNRQISTTPQPSDALLKDPAIENMLLKSPLMKLGLNVESPSTTGAARLALTSKQSQLIPRTPKIQITPQANRSRARLDRSNAFNASVMDQSSKQRLRFDSTALLGTARRATPKKTNNTLSPCSYSMLMPGSARVLSSTVLENSRETPTVATLYKAPEPVAPNNVEAPMLRQAAEESLDKSMMFSIRTPSNGDSTLTGSTLGARSMESMDTVREVGDNMSGSLSSNFTKLKLNPTLMDTSDNVLVDDSF